MIPPIAGPNAVPAAKADMMGAIVDARFRGVDMSAMVIVAAVLRAATPNPTKRRQQNKCSKQEARPIPPTPSDMRDREYTRYGYMERRFVFVLWIDFIFANRANKLSKEQ
mmetsp:Transcript_36800/g.49269  ORF Transcript_36800/g.49269 Transcript_36800/m.49269 type:complete len:110 (-) Transcript_36800:681-1010(-)